jgi:hypothetical protein
MTRQKQINQKSIPENKLLTRVGLQKTSTAKHFLKIRL